MVFVFGESVCLLKNLCVFPESLCNSSEGLCVFCRVSVSFNKSLCVAGRSLCLWQSLYVFPESLCVFPEEIEAAPKRNIDVTGTSCSSTGSPGVALYVQGTVKRPKVSHALLSLPLLSDPYGFGNTVAWT